MKTYRIILTSIFFFILSVSYSQTGSGDSKIDSLTTLLVQQQAGSAEFAVGIFPSYRYQPGKKTRFADDNIFFSAIIAMRLMRHMGHLPPASKKHAETILKNVRTASAGYRNKYGRVSYNFWRTGPVKQFPGDPKLSRKTGYHIPDDVDDSIILTYINKKSRTDVLAVKTMMEENIPGKKRNIRNTLHRFRDLPAYSTWLGDRMPPEFDLCVMANALYVFREYQLPFTGNDWATISYMREAVVYGYVQKRAHRISPQYKTETAILYHLAFLLSAHSVPGLDELKPDITRRTYEKLLTAQSRQEALLLASALTYLKHPLPENYRLPEAGPAFPYFYANTASVIPNPFNGMFSKSKFMNFPYECKGWEVMLELEIMLNQ